MILQPGVSQRRNCGCPWIYGPGTLSARAEMNWIKATRPPIRYRYHHLRRQDIDMDDIRTSISKLKKGFKHRLGGKKHVPDKPGNEAAGERVDPPSPLLQPGPHVAASGHDEKRSGISSDVRKAHSRDPSPQPEPVPADEGCGDPKGKEVDVEGKEVSRRHSPLGPDVEVAAGSGPSQAVQQASPPLALTSIPHKPEPDSTRLYTPQLLYLIIPLHDVDASTVPDRMAQDPHPNENAEPSTTNEGSSWKSTALATAKLLLRGVRDSADAFGPLKSVAGGLCFILENSEVWPPSPTHAITILTDTLANERE